MLGLVLVPLLLPHPPASLPPAPHHPESPVPGLLTGALQQAWTSPRAKAWHSVRLDALTILPVAVLYAGLYAELFNSIV